MTTTTEQQNLAKALEKLHTVRDEYDVAAQRVRHTLQGPAEEHKAAKAAEKQKRKELDTSASRAFLAGAEGQLLRGIMGELTW